jgi:phage terminase large subunit-like protein
MIEAGNILLPMPEEQPWIDDALLEFVTFPAAKHDDRGRHKSGIALVTEQAAGLSMRSCSAK